MQWIDEVPVCEPPQPDRVEGRRLAYDIKKKSEGIYAVIDFHATPDTAKELDRQLGLNEVVLRTKVLRADA